MFHDAYVYANVEKDSDYVEIGASTLDGKKPVKIEDVRNGLAAYSLIEWRLNNLAGRILTQCDAAFSDPVQRKAFKDEIRQKIAEEFGFFSDHLQKEVVESTLAPIEKMSTTEFKEFLKKNPSVEISEVIAPGK